MFFIIVCNRPRPVREETMQSWLTAFLLAAVCLSGCSSLTPSDMTVVDLTCEYRTDPLGIGETVPRLSWKLESSARGRRQTAYHILVASSRENLARDVGDLWDTGFIESDRTTLVEYEGKPLSSRMRCFWKVRSRDENGAVTPFSEPAAWTMGLLSKGDWQGKWIAMETGFDPAKAGELEPGPPPPMFRTTFSLAKPVERATVYVTARGLFDLRINGKRATDDVFPPEWTDYDKRIHYRTYDVTALLAQGENAVGAVVGDGWYSGYIGWRKVRGHYGFTNSLLVQLEVEYGDGTTETVVTDGNWKCAAGPIRSSDFMMGEVYDARREMPGWDTASFDDSGWKAVAVVDPPGAELVWQPSEPVRVTERLTPVSVTEPKRGVHVFDLGQNIAGWARLRTSGPAGTKITLRFAERLSPDGTIYTENLRAAKATDVYILKGGGEEVYEPSFTFHGFQYVEVTGLDRPPSTETVTGCVVHSDTPPAGTFECSHPLVNRLWLNARWSQRGNFISIPTDCPQRDERLGWMGDAQIFIRTATYNMDVAAFFTKWMTDVEDAQSERGAFADTSPRLRDHPTFEAAPGWGDAGIIVPWTIWRVYGDTRIIARHWDAMTKWMDFLRETNPDLLRRRNLNNNYGDWLSIRADTPKDLLATAYWAYDASLMADMARAIGRDDEAMKYDGLFADVRDAFQREFVDADGRVYPVHGARENTGMDASGTERGGGETQTNYVLALYFDLLPEPLRENAVKYLVDNIRERGWHLSTGFIGVRHLNPVLTDAGRADLAYRLLTQETYPSWLYPVKNGATTIWERWDGWTEEKGFQNPGMNSFNHYAFGSICEWLYGSVAGIRPDPDTPAYKKIVIHPWPDASLDFARASYESIHGRIESGWERDGDTLRLDVAVPVNTTATVYVPADENTEVMEGGVSAAASEGVTFLRREDGYAVYEVGSGSYRFESRVRF